MCLLLFPKTQKRQKRKLSDFKEDIFSIEFQQHMHTNAHKYTTYKYINMYTRLPQPQF